LLAERTESGDGLSGDLGALGGEGGLDAFVRLGLQAATTTLLEVDLDPTDAVGVELAIEVVLQDLADLVTGQTAVCPAEQLHHPRLDHW
jgi:hypothetical protein